MTKGGSGKPKTLGRLIFGEKRKQHVSPARHQSSTRNGDSTTDVSTPGGTSTSKNSINLHDWAVWRMQLNEQMIAGMTDRRSDLKQMRQFLQSNPFYQQHSRDSSTGRCNKIRLLFSIPHAKFKPELLDESLEGIIKSNINEVGDTRGYEPKKIRSNSDDRTAMSVTSASAVQPKMVIDKTISQLFPKALIGNTGGFLQINEQMIAADGLRNRRTGRSSFRTSDRIHSTLQKAVKDGNVLEKIKAFEMQAAAAQAEYAIKLASMNHRISTIATSSTQSAAHRTLSPAIKHPIHLPISPIPVQQPIRSSRGRYVHPVQHHRDGAHGLSESRKGPHVLEPAHGDIILKRQTPSQKPINDEDYSITAITSMAMTGSHGHHHRTSASRSKHRQDKTCDKRTSSNNENSSHKHQQKQKRTTTPSAKPSTRHRWLKGRKETPTEMSIQSDKQDISITKSNKKSKNKNKNTEKEKIDSKKVSKSVNKGKSSTDNNRVYGVPNADIKEQTKIELPPSKIEEESESDRERDMNDNTNTYMSPRDIDRSQSRECETVIAATIQQQPSKKQLHPQKLSTTNGEILGKVDDDTRFSRPIDDHAHRLELNNEGDIFIEDLPIKPSLKIIRHQSVLYLPNNGSRRLQQQQHSSNTIRRHASQRTADEHPSTRRYPRSKENPELINKNPLKKKQQPPTTLIPRKNQDEQNVYETPHSEQIQIPVCNSHTLKKKRAFHTINAIGSSKGEHHNNKQISKQILHAIMNSMNNNNNQEQSTLPPASVNDEFFENGPLTNPEETISNITAAST